MALACGEVLGRYEIVRLLGRGGMAEVYLANMRGLGGFVKEVALKCVLPELVAEAELTQMFLDEARTAARLQHPNIVQVFDIGQEGNQLFFAMEYVRGTDARAVLREAQGHAVPLGRAVAIALGTAAASHHAHELGVIHRDISPSNVLISSAGIIKLADFGIAKAASNRNVTQSGVVKGKLGYMSPEQCRGGALDRRSDIYSLGVLLYQLSTGRLPFAETNPLAFAKTLATRDPPPPTQFVEGYPTELEQIVLRAIARDPANRFATAAELERELAKFSTQYGLDVSPRALAADTEPTSNDAALASLSPSFVTASVAFASSPEPTAVTVAASPRRRRRPRAVVGLAVVATAIGAALVAHRVVSSGSSGAPVASPPAMPPVGAGAQPPTHARADEPVMPAVATPAPAAPPPPTPHARTQPAEREAAQRDVGKRDPARAQTGRARARKSSNSLEKPPVAKPPVAKPSVAKPSASSEQLSTSPDDPLPGAWRPN